MVAQKPQDKQAARAGDEKVQSKTDRATVDYCILGRTDALPFHQKAIVATVPKSISETRATA